MKLNYIFRQKVKSVKKSSNFKFFKASQVKKSNYLSENRFNDVKIQMLPQSLYQQIFKNPSEKTQNEIYIEKYVK